MKKNILLILILAGLNLFSQNTQIIYLDSCINQSIANFKIADKDENASQISILQHKLSKIAYLPNLKMEAIATYQSAALKINLPIPNLYLPSVPLDQYKTYVEVNQLLFDGGTNAINSKMADIVLQISNAQNQIQTNEIRNNVAKTFYYLLILQKQLEIIGVQLELLDEQMKYVNSGVENQSLPPVNRDILKVEILRVQQSLNGTKALFEAAFEIMTFYTGNIIKSDSKFELIESDTVFSDSANNPKVDILEYQKRQNELLSQQLLKNRYPKIMAFGQFGIGRPGLNMLSDSFDPYYYVGIKFSWQIYDWHNASNNVKINNLKNQNIDIDLNNLEIADNIKKVNIKAQIISLTSQLQNDKDILNLSENIVKTYSSQLKNGYISMNDYILQLNKLTQAKMLLELHQIQLYQLKFELENPF